MEVYLHRRSAFVMFDLNEDPYETVNLAFQHRYLEKRQELQAELAAWIERTGDEYLLPEL